MFATAARAYRVAALALLAVAADVAFDPMHRHLPLCPFHALTGWQCPLCGGLRAIAELAHGRPTAALRDNLLVVLAVPVVAALWLRWARTGRAGRRWPRAATVAIIALAVAFTVLRNLPSFAVLRPAA